MVMSVVKPVPGKMWHFHAAELADFTSRAGFASQSRHALAEVILFEAAIAHTR